MTFERLGNTYGRPLLNVLQKPLGLDVSDIMIVRISKITRHVFGDLCIILLF